MCGIAGILGSNADVAATAKKMADAIIYRGPDSGAVWSDPESRVALGHRRLAIVDLSPAGDQPMTSSCGRYVIAYNGEVYNAPDLRQKLEEAGRTFRGHSDTEVILEGFSLWGIRQTIDQAIGMFAIALWDRKERELTLIRDRLGIKPLYWGQFGDTFIYGSELKALCAAPGWKPRLDRDSIASFLRHNYIPAPWSIYKGVQKLEPGSILTVRHGQTPRIARFWTVDEMADRGLGARKANADLADEEAIQTLDTLLSDAVSRRMISDVPFGAFLSGGIDSSTVVALMQKASSTPVKTFSIGFSEDGYDEAKHAKAIAGHLGTEHTELYVSPDDALAVIPKLPSMYDEPFSDSSQIPTFLVSEMTRRHVTVALSGDGGDELFAGYNRYFLAKDLARKFRRFPPPIRSAAAGLIDMLSPGGWDRLAAVTPKARDIPQFGDKMHKLASVLRQSDEHLYYRLVSHWTDPSAIVTGGEEHASIILDPALKTRIPDAVERMQFLDTKTYLPDDILTKVDRASMAVSLEARVPILDHRVAEYAWTLPERFKIRNGQSKWILREVLSRYVPRALFERPKMGFGVPIDSWLRGPLRDWAEDLLDERRLSESGIFNPAPIRETFESHIKGTRNNQYLLWDILMFQAWHRENGLPQ